MTSIHYLMLCITGIAMFLIVYPYIIYPCLVKFLSRSYSFPAAYDETWPSITFIVSVYNSEHAIRKKIGNILQLEYPPENIEVIVVSDGSTDGTVPYLNSLHDERIAVLDLRDRSGKTEAENRAIPLAKGEIIVFTDSTTLLDSNALKEMILPFADRKVGAVTTVDKLVESQEKLVGEGEQMYVSLEMLIRKWECAAGMLIGLSGSCFACRRELCEPIPPETARDLSTALSSLKRGYVNVSAERAFCLVRTQDDIRKEFYRKIRTINNGVATVMQHADLLHVLRFGRISFALVSHKIIRWLSFPCLIAIAICSTFLTPFWLGRLWLSLQVMVFLCAVYSLMTGRSFPVKPLRIAVNFVVACCGAFVGILEYFAGKRYVVWAPTKRT